jgi:hypothetical protein
MRASLRLCKLVEVSKAGLASSPRPKTRQRELAQNPTFEGTPPSAMRDLVAISIT